MMRGTSTTLAVLTAATVAAGCGSPEMEPLPPQPTRPEAVYNVVMSPIGPDGSIPDPTLEKITKMGRGLVQHLADDPGPVDTRGTGDSFAHRVYRFSLPEGAQVTVRPGADDASTFHGALGASVLDSATAYGPGGAEGDIKTDGGTAVKQPGGNRTAFFSLGGSGTVTPQNYGNLVTALCNSLDASGGSDSGEASQPVDAPTQRVVCRAVGAAATDAAQGVVYADYVKGKGPAPAVTARLYSGFGQRFAAQGTQQ